MVQSARSYGTDTRKAAKNLDGSTRTILQRPARRRSPTVRVWWRRSNGPGSSLGVSSRSQLTGTVHPSGVSRGVPVSTDEAMRRCAVKAITWSRNTEKSGIS